MLYKFSNAYIAMGFQMIVYSQKIIHFINQIKQSVLSILSKEVGLKVTGERFYNSQKTMSYPIKIVIFNNKSMLGYFDSEFLELGFHECLMRSSKEQLHDMIRHELAHYMTYVLHGHVQAHGHEFRAFCQKMGWGENVYKATTCLDDGHLTQTSANPILNKIQKLLALSQSSNEHEAELAMIRSQQLLLKYNLDIKDISSVNEDCYVLKRIMKMKRENAKMRATAKILETFLVSTVISKSSDSTYLEIVGTEVNVEIADYVASVLEHELEKLWYHVQLTTSLRGQTAKNSFFLGIAKGYCNKIQALKKGYDISASHALISLEKQLMDAQTMVYPRLKTVTRKNSYCASSSMLGEQAGKNLNINPAINKRASTQLIGFTN